MVRRYAETTTVPSEKSIGEIIRYLEDREADAMPLSSRDRLAVQFDYGGRLYRIMYTVPPAGDFNPERHMFSDDLAQWRQKRREQERRRLWRVVLMRIKMAFEDIDSGERTAEQVLLPYIVLPSGETVEEAMLPMIEQAYETGRMPQLADAFWPSQPLLPVNEDAVPR